MYRRAQNELGIQASLESSGIGVLLKIQAAETDAQWAALETLHNQSNLSTATGASLDSIALRYGVPRRQERQATTLGLLRAVRFTNLGAATVVIPAQTRVWKGSDPRVAFMAVEGVTLEPGAQAEVHVQAPEGGTFYNVAVGEITNHSVPGVSVSVTNILPIQNGQDRESDDSFRQRVLQEVRRRTGLTQGNVVAMLRGVPGVKDAYLVDKARGAGTFDVYIIPHNERQTSQVVSDCQARLTEAVPVGISAIAKPPAYRQLDIRIVLTFSPGVGGRADAVRDSVRTQIISAIASLPVEDGSGNGTLYLPRIRAIAMGADSSVIEAAVEIKLDGAYQMPAGQVNLKVGDRILLRGLSVQ